MPDPTPADAAALLARASTLADDSLRAIARAEGYSDSTVRKALARFAPVQESLAHVKRESGVAAWQTVQFKALAAIDQFLDGETPLEVGEKSSVSAEIRNLAVAAGIASEKALLFAGQPTQITAQTHEARLALPERVALLAQLAERMARLAGASAAGTPALAQESGSAGPIIEAESRAVR